MTSAPPPPRLPYHGRLVVTPLSDRDGLRLCGEADLLSVGVLEQAIAALPPRADPIHLHLAALEFIDVAAVRELVTMARRPGRPMVIMHNPPPVLLRIMQLLWPHVLPRFSVGAERDRAAPAFAPNPAAGTCCPVSDRGARLRARDRPGSIPGATGRRRTRS